MSMGGHLSDPRRILVIRRDNIGDLICTTPLLRALRERFPAARIDALVNSYNCPVLAGNSDVDHVYAYTKAKHREHGESLLAVYWRRFGLLRSLRAIGYECVILANDGDTQRALKLVRWIAPRHVIGFVPKGQAMSGIDLAITPDEQPAHAVEIAYRLLAPLGIRGEPPALRLEPNQVELEHARSMLHAQPWYMPDAPTIAIHISARKPRQRWPIDRFSEMIMRLHASHRAQFLLFWAPGDEHNPLHPGDDGKAAELLKAAEGLPLLPYPTARLQELIGGIAVCDSVICSDGGAMHVAAGLGKPIVCFFGNSDAVRWRPWGVPFELLQKASLDVGDIDVDEALAAYERLSRQRPGI